MPWRRILIFILPIAFALCVAKADTEKLYTSDELTSAFISCIEQTHQGYLWVGTGNGLNRFDGYHFKQYSYKDGDTTSLPHKIVTSLFTDNSGVLWVGTARGLSYYDEKSDKFVWCHMSGKWGEEPRVSQITQLSDGRVVVATSGFGLYEIDGNRRQARHLKLYTTKADDDYVASVHADSQNRFWKGTSDGRISCYALQGRLLLNYNPDYGQPLKVIDGRGGDVIAVFNNGIVIFSKSFRKKSESRSPHGISSAFLTRDNRLLVGTSHGLMQFGANGIFTPVAIDNRDIDFSATNILSVFEDRQRNLWLSCSGRGLFFVSHSGHGFTSWTFSDQGIKTGSNITAVANASDGGLWVSLRGSNIYHFSKEGHIDKKITVPEGLNFVYRGNSGHLWVGVGASLYQLNESAGTLSLYKTFDCDYLQTMTEVSSQPSHGLPSPMQFISTFGRGLAVLSGLDNGNHKVQGSNLKVQAFSMASRNSAQGSVCNDWIFSFLPDSHGLLWIGTSSGVSCYNPANGDFRPFGWMNILEGHGCMSLAENKDGNIVIGTVEGLYLFDRKRNKVMAFPHSEQLKGMGISSILSEQNGDLWFSSNNGLWHYDYKHKQFVGHINDNGLHEHEFAENTGLRLDDGRLVFASNNTVILFSPDEIDGKPVKPSALVLTELNIGGESISPSLHGLSDDGSLSFSYSDNTFSLSFSNFDFCDASNTILEYRLDDDPWSQIQRGQNAVTFSHLQPGTYKLHVRASENGQYSNEQIYSITIHAPWYRSTLAYIIYIVLLLSLVAYVWWRIQNRKRVRLAMQQLQETIDSLLSKEHQPAAKSASSVENYSQQVEQREVTDNDRVLMERIMKSVNKNMDDSDYNVEAMASDAGLSRSQLNRKMKELTGLSPSDFLRTLRLDQAAKLLKSHNTNITQVAYAVGFASQNTFTKAFKQHFGTSPSEYASNGSGE